MFWLSVLCQWKQMQQVNKGAKEPYYVRLLQLGNF